MNAAVIGVSILTLILTVIFDEGEKMDNRLYLQGTKEIGGESGI